MRALLTLAATMLVASPAVAQKPAPVTPEARAALGDFARCVVRHSNQKARATLRRNFTTRVYRDELRALARNNRHCFDVSGRLRTGGLPFAAALAEALLADDPDPLNIRLLKAAPTKAPTYSPSDAVAMCVVRSDPDNAAALLRSAIASAEEAKAAATLQVALGRCTPAGQAVDADAYGLRTVLATAAYRLLDAGQ